MTEALHCIVTGLYQVNCDTLKIERKGLLILFDFRFCNTTYWSVNIVCSKGLWRQIVLGKAISMPEYDQVGTFGCFSL